MNAKIRKQADYVEQCEAAVQHYKSEMDAGRSSNYGNLSRLLNTALDIACAENGKLNAMLATSNQ